MMDTNTSIQLDISRILLNTSFEHKLRRIFQQENYRLSNQPLFDSLTKREIEILIHVVQGYTNPQIAEKLFISRNTVEQHRKNIKRKLPLNTFSDLFQFALAFDLV